MSEWGEIRTRFIWELIQKTAWEDRATVLELMDIEYALNRCYAGERRLNRIENDYIMKLFDKYPRESEIIELELQVKYMGDDAPMLKDEEDEDQFDLDEFLRDNQERKADTNTIIEAVERALLKFDSVRNGQRQAQGQGRSDLNDRDKQRGSRDDQGGQPGQSDGEGGEGGGKPKPKPEPEGPIDK